MKKAFALLLALAMVLSMGAMAFAADSPSGSAASRPAYTGPVYYLCDQSDKVVKQLFAGDVIETPVGEADKLEAADKEAFLAAYKDAQGIEGQSVKYCYWIALASGEKLPQGVAYMGYYFYCTGNNVKVMVNGKEMEVVKKDTNYYYAKLTELGAVTILCD